MTQSKLVFSTLFASTLLLACSPKKDHPEQTAASSVNETKKSAPTQQHQIQAFNLHTLKHAHQDIGEFPYVDVPIGYTFILPVEVVEQDYYYFPIQGKYQKLEGKLATVTLTTERNHERLAVRIPLLASA